MPEEFMIRVQCEHLGKSWGKYFKDKETKEYYRFRIINVDSLPDKCLYRPKMFPYLLLISSELTNKDDIDFEAGKKYWFDMTVGESSAGRKKKIANFKYNNSNTMVLKAPSYFTDTVQKIGLLGSENYFYPPKKDKNKKSNNNSDQSENKSNWISIILICSPFLILFLFFCFLVKWINKKQK